MSEIDRLLLGPLAPLWLVYGDATPLVVEAVRRLTEVALEEVGLPAFNHSEYRAGEADAAEALATARTLPMMASRRLVVVRDLQDAPDELFAAVVDYAGGPSESTVLLLTGAAFPKVRKGGKNWSARVQNAFKKHGRVLKLAASAVPSARFAHDEAERLGKRLARPEAELLVDVVGDDLARLRQEVEKLALYVGDRPEIGQDDVMQACSQVAASVVWDLSSAIVARDADTALATLHRQLEEGEDPRKLLGIIAWQLREVLKAAELLRKGASQSEVSKATRLRWRQVPQLQRALASGKVAGAADTLGRIARANRMMNEHRAGDRRILERLVLELCVE